MLFVDFFEQAYDFGLYCIEGNTVIVVNIDILPVSFAYKVSIVFGNGAQTLYAQKHFDLQTE